MNERVTRDKSADTLHSVAPHTLLLDMQGANLLAGDPLPIPTNEFDIPNVKLFLNQVLGSVATDYCWRGFEDIHHIAWRASEYVNVWGAPGRHTGALFRGCASLKIPMPRQMHNYLHIVSEPLTPPCLDVMEQYIFEDKQAQRLYHIVKEPSEKTLRYNPRLADPTVRYEMYLDALESTLSGEVGLMPSIEELYGFDLETARTVIGAIARVRSVQEVVGEGTKINKIAA